MSLHFARCPKRRRAMACRNLRQSKAVALSYKVLMWDQESVPQLVSAHFRLVELPVLD